MSAAGALVVLALVGADADGALVLRYERGPADCPTAEAFRDLVAARLGRDPFVEKDADVASVRFHREEEEIVATAEIDRGAKTSARSLRAAADQCGALAESVALALAIVLESPPARSAPPPDEDAAPPPPPVPDRIEHATPLPPPPKEPEKETPSRPSLRVAAALGGTAAAGLTPGLSLGVEFGILLRGTTWGAQVGGRVHALPSTVVLEDRDPVDATIMTARVLGCGHFDPWALCLAGDLGAFRARVENAERPGAISTFVAVGGVRLAYQAELGPRFTVRLAAELLANLVRTELVLNAAPIWSAPPVAGAATVAVVANIL